MEGGGGGTRGTSSGTGRHRNSVTGKCTIVGALHTHIALPGLLTSAGSLLALVQQDAQGLKVVRPVTTNAPQCIHFSFIHVFIFFK